MTRYKKTVRYELRGSLTMERYRDIMADVEARKLPLPVEIVSTSNGGPNGSPNYTFTIKP